MDGIKSTPGTHILSRQTQDTAIVDFMLGQRRRRWANIKSTLAQRLVISGISPRPILLGLDVFEV